MTIVDKTLAKLAELIQQSRFDELETDTLELKPLPATGTDWKQRYKSVNAFLNTRGGIMIVGIKEEGQGTNRRYAITGYRADAEAKLKELSRAFTDRRNVQVDLTDSFPPMEIRELLGKRVAIVYVDELPADRKFCFYQGEAYKRILTGDHRLSDSEIEAQEEYKEEALQARELQPIEDLTVEDFDIDKLNEYIHQLNRLVKIETIKPDLIAAQPFLERKCFVKDGKVTTLGMLVCGKHPADRLGFRCQVHGYVDAPQVVAQDKQDFSDNILPLMENSLAYILRNIQVGVSVQQGGKYFPEYPEELLRETVNNALAHRDYSINKQVIITIKPGAHIAIKNPGAFRRHLLIDAPDHRIPLHRIVPEAKPRNPKLADVLRVYRKWEGRGIGMATLVNLCLQNLIDLPYYKFYTDDVCLFLCSGTLLDDRMERLFQGYNRYTQERLSGNQLTHEQKLVLSYLIKSEWANERQAYTILLTSDNNHFNELRTLENAGLISKHSAGTSVHPVYMADRTLLKKDYVTELRSMFGETFDALDELKKRLLSVVFRFNHFSTTPYVSAKQAAFVLWHEQDGASGSIEDFDRLYRRVRNAFNSLQDQRFVKKLKKGKISAGYELKNPEKSMSSKTQRGLFDE